MPGAQGAQKAIVHPQQRADEAGDGKAAGAVQRRCHPSSRRSQPADRGSS